MTLYEYMKSKECSEFTVYDKEYSMESYFYNDAPEDDFDRGMEIIAKSLDVIETKDYKVTVNLFDLIKQKLDKIKEANLFFINTLDDIMLDMENILSGWVSEEWMLKFAKVLSE